MEGVFGAALPAVAIALSFVGVPLATACSPWIQYGDGVVVDATGAPTPATLILSEVCDGPSRVAIHWVDRPGIVVNVMIDVLAQQHGCLMDSCGFGDLPGGAFTVTSDLARIELTGYAAPSTATTAAWVAFGSVDGAGAIFVANAARSPYSAIPDL